jgi:tetratricopeptide (TPR) repeat protein
MKRTPGILALFAVAFASLLCPARKLHAQQPPEESSSKPAEPPPAPPPKSPAKKNKDSATQSAPDQPTWDPLRAEKDLEVGHYYMRRGDYDAAIDRFNDAIEAKPGYAVPFKFLGEAQEKKKLRKQAIKSYTRYLELFPSAEDGDKIRKKIDKLWSEVGEKKKQS